MASTSAPASPAPGIGRDREVSLIRLYVMRAMYLVYLIPPGPLPHLVYPDLTGRGMITCMLGGMSVIALLGVRYPLQMLPFLLFECVWKTIWLVTFGLPKWQAGVSAAQFNEDIILIGGGGPLFALIIPWTYVWRHYVKERSERWR